jgi:acetyltransferase-like isoleucine patch superfamily enzyme
MPRKAPRRQNDAAEPVVGELSRVVRRAGHTGTLTLARIAESLAWRLAPGFLGKIARNAVYLYPFMIGEDLSRISIAPGVALPGAFLNCGSGRITIEQDVFTGYGVSILAGTHDRRKTGPARAAGVPTEGYDIVIREGAWIASNATVLGPCVIGAHAVVAAGAVVTRDVPDYALVAGIPARVVSTLEDAQRSDP